MDVVELLDIIDNTFDNLATFQLIGISIGYLFEMGIVCFESTFLQNKSGN